MDIDQSSSLIVSDFCCDSDKINNNNNSNTIQQKHHQQKVDDNSKNGPVLTTVSSSSISAFDDIPPLFSSTMNATTSISTTSSTSSTSSTTTTAIISSSSSSSPTTVVAAINSITNDHPTRSELIPLLRTTCLLLPTQSNTIDGITLLYPPGLDPTGYHHSATKIPQSNFVTLPIQRRQQQNYRKQQSTTTQSSSDTSSSSESTSTTNNIKIRLPLSSSPTSTYISSSSTNVDEWFTTIPLIVQRCTTFLSQPVIELNSSTIELILYVGQREIAHVDSSTTASTKNLLLVSDRATTCHILVLRSYTVYSSSSTSSSSTTSSSTTSSSSTSSSSTTSATSSSSTTKSPALCSIAHLDSCSFTDCIRSTFYRHRDFHHHHQRQQQQQNQQCCNDEGSCNNTINTGMEKTQQDDHNNNNNNDNSTNNTSKPKVIIDIHIVGGFVERNQQQQQQTSSSQKLSNWLLHLLADIAQELYSDNVIMILQTIAISCMNTITEQMFFASSSSFDLNDNISINRIGLLEGHVDHNNLQQKEDKEFVYNSYPNGRSIAINCTTGHVFLARCTRDVMGPAIIVRNVRLWSCTSTPKQHKKLVDLCTNNSNCNNNNNNNNSGNQITIQPFYYKYDPYLYDLMKLPDPVLLQYCSTSPHCEEDDFCSLLRETVQFLSTIPCSYIFSCNTTITSSSTTTNQKSRTSVLGCIDDDGDGDDNTNEMDTDNNVGSIDSVNRCKQVQQKQQQQPQEQKCHLNPQHPLALIKKRHTDFNNQKQHLQPLVFQRCQVQVNSWRLVKSP